MPYEDGWAAINLEMPRRIPRTEYSAEGHWDLIRAVTGIAVGVDSPDEVKSEASVAFMRAWHYDFFWSTLIGRDEFGEVYTDMDHAEYAADTRILLSGTKDQIRAEVERCMSRGWNCPGFCMAVHLNRP